MRILAVDDEKFALASLTDAIREAAPDAELCAYASGREALARAAEAVDADEVPPFDVAFLDIRLRDMTGLELGLRLKQIAPRINVVFVTGYDEYLMPAMRQRCSGYLLKPVQAAEVADELQNLRYPVEAARARVHAQTFGNFELFVDGAPVVLETKRSRELLAYLVDRRGASVTNGQIAATIWEENTNTTSAQAQVRKAKAGLVRSLEAAGAGSILRADHRSMAVDPSQMSCDYWQLLDGEPAALNSFTGEYMSGYSWAESTLGAILFQRG